MRTRSGRVVHPRRLRDFDYTGVLLQLGFTQTSTKTCSYSSTSAHSFSNSDSFLEPLSIVSDSAHAPLRAHANIGTMPLIQESMMRRGQRICREQCLQLANLKPIAFTMSSEAGLADADVRSSKQYARHQAVDDEVCDVGSILRVAERRPQKFGNAESLSLAGIAVQSHSTRRT